MLTSTAISNALSQENRNFIYTATITLKNGTVLTITNDRIWNGGFEYEDAISDESDFQLGSAIINKFSLTINNMDRAYSSYDFTMATVVIRVGVSAGSVQRGKYYVNEAIYNDPLITLDCYDYMMRFDQPYSLSTTVYDNGVTLAEILRGACSDCDVVLMTQTFDNSSVVVNKRPEGSGTTFRNVVSWVAQIAGCVARCDVQGRLVLKKLSPTSVNASIPVSQIFSHSVSVKPITFSGITFVVTDSEHNMTQDYAFGVDGYVMNISGNPFVTPENVQTIGSYLWSYIQTLNGRFYKANVSHLCNPLLEAGDRITITDRNGSSYGIFITKTTYTSNESQKTVCSAKDPARSYSGAISLSTKTLIEAQQLVFNEKTDRELMYEQLEEAINAKTGLYMTTEAGTGGGLIYYLHDQPLLADSKLVWKMTSDAFAVTNNYNGENPGQTVWMAGLTVDGNLIANIMSTIGINFDWGVGGELRIKNQNNVETLYANANTGVVRINADSLCIGGNSVNDIATSAAQEAVISATNLLLSPDDLTNWTYWRSNGQGAGVDGSNGVVGGQTDPNGGTNAFKVTKGSYGTNTVLRVSTANNPIKSAGQNYRFSVWMKASSTGTVNMYLNGQSNVETASLTTSWQRYTMDVSADTVTSDTDYYLCIGGNTSWTPQTIYFYGPIVEYTDASMTQEEIFNTLTGNRQTEALILHNGHLYLNASYINTGALSVSKTVGGSSVETFYANADTGVVRINADSVSIGGTSVSDVASNTATSVATSIATEAAKDAVTSATNLLLSPDDLTNWTYWRSNGSGVGSDSNGVVGGQTDPTGGGNAFKVTKGTNGTNTVLRVPPENNPIKSAGQNYKFSVWMKASASRTVNVYFNGVDGNSVNTVALTTSWKRYTFEIYASSITSYADYYLCIGGGGSWNPNVIYFYAPIVEYADPYMSQEQTFNQLTNNGTVQGINLTNGQLYINASYINTGTLSASRIKGGTLTLGGSGNVNGVLSVLNSNGSPIASLSSSGGMLKTINSTVGYAKLDGDLLTFTSINGNAEKIVGQLGTIVDLTSIVGCELELLSTNGANLAVGSSLNGATYTMSVLPNQNIYKFLFSHTVRMDKDLWVRGNLQVDGTYPTSSDERLKDIGIWSVPNDFLSEVEPIQFKWNDDRDDDKVHYGFGAQSVKELLDKHGMEDSGIVYYDEHQDRYYINYLEFIPILTDKVQRLEAENSYLRDQLGYLEKRLSKLETLLEESLNRKE